MAWRYAMIVPGLMMLVIAFLYYRFAAEGTTGLAANEAVGPAANELVGDHANTGRSGRPARKIDWSVLADWRVGALTLAYASCFGMEITFDNVACLHFVDSFQQFQRNAGFWAGIFGSMNIFARALGGIASDRAGLRWGIRGKGWLLAAVLLLEGVGLLVFAGAGSFAMAILFMLSFGLFLKMANGAVYGIVPFIDAKNIGLISGVVGAGGNVGGMLFGFLFKSASMTYVRAFADVGIVVMAVSAIVFITSWRKPSDAGDGRTE